MIKEAVEYAKGNFTVHEEKPTTMAELMTATGLTEEEIVSEAVGNLYYRGKYPRVYDKVSKKIVSDLSYPRLQVSSRKKKDGTEVPIFENDIAHILAALGGRKDKEGNVTEAGVAEGSEKIDSLFQTIAPSEPLYVAGEARGGGKIPQKAVDTANQILASGADAVQKAIDTIEAHVPNYTVAVEADGSVSPDNLARGINTLGKYLAAEQEKKTKGLLGV